MKIFVLIIDSFKTLQHFHNFDTYKTDETSPITTFGLSPSHKITSVNVIKCLERGWWRKTKIQLRKFIDLDWCCHQMGNREILGGPRTCPRDHGGSPRGRYHGRYWCSLSSYKWCYWFCLRSLVIYRRYFTDTKWRGSSRSRCWGNSCSRGCSRRSWCCSWSSCRRRGRWSSWRSGSFRRRSSRSRGSRGCRRGSYRSRSRSCWSIA